MRNALQKNHEGLLLLCRSALAGGKAILERFPPVAADVGIKSDKSPVTAADLASHRAIMRILKQGAPEINVISEENVGIPYEIRSRWDQLILVDPLDGTKEYLAGRDEFSVLIAWLSSNVPVLGVVYAPVSDTLYFACAGSGAFRISRASTVAGPDGAGRALLEAGERLPLVKGKGSDVLTVAVSRSHLDAETVEYVESMQRSGKKMELLKMGGALKLCLVAEGSADSYPRMTPSMEWDIAAGYLIAQEAGCTIRAVPEGSRLTFNKQVLINPGFIVERPLE